MLFLSDVYIAFRTYDYHSLERVTVRHCVYVHEYHHSWYLEGCLASRQSDLSCTLYPCV